MTSTPNTTSDAILDRLLALHPKLVDLSLGRMARLLAALGHPERALPPVVHVTGTNGKGSLLAMLGAMLEAAGYRVHVYTSPHLVRFHERIRLAGELIEEAALSGLLAECERANGAESITFFEITTAAAFLAFSRTPADILLLENGLGGRLDATNVVDRPALTAITPVSLDHQQFLGETIDAIAFEKAGIMKPGVPCVLAPQADAAAAVIEERARVVGAPVLLAGRDWGAAGHASGLRYEDQSGVLDLPPPALAGAHQITNAGMAVACARNLSGFELSADHIAQGLRDASWPGRLQHLTRGPLVEVLPAGWELWFDGGHNPAAGEHLARHAAEAWSDRPLDLIVGMLNSKNWTGFLEPLAPHARRMVAVPVSGSDASLSPETLAETAAGLGLDGVTATDPGAAIADLANATSVDTTPVRVLICGSLYLGTEVLADNA